MIKLVHDNSDLPFEVGELPPSPRFTLRTREEHREALERAFGFALPARIGRCERGAHGDIACLGPDEWLVLPSEPAALLAASAEAYGQTPHSLCDISSREVSLRIRGPLAVDALATCCARDLTALEDRRAVRTLFDSATVILWRDGRDSFRMDVWSSFLPHVRSLLNAVQAELRTGL